MAYTKRLGEMRAVDLLVACVALVLLVLSTVWFFGTIPVPPQHWFVYYFLAFIVAGAIAYRLKKASG